MSVQVKISILVFVVAAAVAGGILYFVMSRKAATGPVAPTSSNGSAVQVDNIPVATTDVGEATPGVNKPAEPEHPYGIGDSLKTPVKDSDQDGLSDEDEKKYGTDPNVVDTDGDGIPDVDEIKTFHTDPLKKNTVPR